MDAKRVPLSNPLGFQHQPLEGAGPEGPFGALLVLSCRVARATFVELSDLRGRLWELCQFFWRESTWTRKRTKFRENNSLDFEICIIAILTCWMCTCFDIRLVLMGQRRLETHKIHKRAPSETAEKSTGWKWKIMHPNPSQCWSISGNIYLDSHGVLRNTSACFLSLFAKAVHPLDCRPNCG